MLKNSNYIQYLNEFIPFIKQLQGCIVVVKYGGAAMKDSVLKQRVINNIIFLHNLGVKIVLVHGGGPMINSWLERLDIKPQFENGIRITNSETMKIVEMVLVGQVNKDLVNLFNQDQTIAVGLSGKDAKLITASQLLPHSNNLVGNVNCINVQILNLLLNSNYIPVIASVASDENGVTCNINADTVAGSIAQALEAYKLILLTDTPGIMLDITNPSSLQKILNIEKIDKLCNKGIIAGGMIPKVECCINALKNKVKSTHIIDGRVQDSLLLELLTEDRLGTQITS
uniref:Acetylglutamate kinase n=1 Tax=Antithamnion hubbsii TaxID=1005974 RepID=A0A4D6WK43_9FLOR|nr:acetylglutamate kinase [Antithamnion hubbsii]